MKIDEVMKELAQYTRLQEETAAIIEGLKDKIKRYMEEHNTDILIGNEHKVTYKAVSSSRIDTTELKKDMPDIASKYTHTTQSKRFVFQ